MKKKPNASAASPSELITQRIADLGDWRGKLLARLRKLIKQAEPGISEEWKWRGTPVWERGGGICTGETYKSVVKLTFFRGASLKDPAKLFNSSLEGNTRRAIDFHETDEVNEAAFKELIRAAAAANLPKGALKNGDRCTVIAGTHAGKSGTVKDLKTSKTGHVTITVQQADGERFKTLGRNVVVKKGKA